MKDLMNIVIYYRYQVAKDSIDILSNAFYCDEYCDKGLYFELYRDDHVIGLIFKNVKMIVKR